jgi:hypothetical protein
MKGSAMRGKTTLPLLAFIATSCVIGSIDARAAGPLSDAWMDRITAGAGAQANATAWAASPPPFLALTLTSANTFALPMFADGYAYGAAIGLHTGTSADVTLSNGAGTSFTINVSVPGASASVAAGYTISP